MGTQPADAVSIWLSTCADCSPGSLMYEWGWVLEDGTRVHCLAGDDEKRNQGALSFSAARMRRAQKKRKMAGRR